MYLRGGRAAIPVAPRELRCAPSARARAVPADGPSHGGLAVTSSPPAVVHAVRRAAPRRRPRRARRGPPTGSWRCSGCSGTPTARRRRGRAERSSGRRRTCPGARWSARAASSSSVLPDGTAPAPWTFSNTAGHRSPSSLGAGDDLAAGVAVQAAVAARAARLQLAVDLERPRRSRIRAGGTASPSAVRQWPRRCRCKLMPAAPCTRRTRRQRRVPRSTPSVDRVAYA